MPNIHEPDWDQIRDHPGFLARRARIGHQAGSRRVGLSVCNSRQRCGADHWRLRLGSIKI